MSQIPPIPVPPVPVQPKTCPVQHGKPETASSSSWISCWYKGLPCPGPFDQLHKESRAVFANNFLFDGAKVDFGKGLSPHFQVTQSWTMGSQVAPPSYQLGGIMADKNYMVYTSIDHEGSISARANYQLTSKMTGKCQFQKGAEAGQLMGQLELDYQGRSYTANVKAVNPSPSQLTGIYVGNYLQSISKNIAVGAEVVYQHPNPQISETQTSGVLRVAVKDGVWTTTASQMGILQTSYQHKLNEQVELAAELQMMVAQGRREGVCTVGGKWEFRTSTFRGQVDTNGRVAAVLEERLDHGLAVLFSGEIDHKKGASKFGVGLAFEQ